MGHMDGREVLGTTTVSGWKRRGCPIVGFGFDKILGGGYWTEASYIITLWSLTWLGSVDRRMPVPPLCYVQAGDGHNRPTGQDTVGGECV